jgi:UDP-N-acetylmuramate-alanine ligase
MWARGDEMQPAGTESVLGALMESCSLVQSFTGTCRRLHKLSTVDVLTSPQSRPGRITSSSPSASQMITVYDDYAHHPTEVQASLQALLAAHPEASVWIAWEPITRARMEAFMDDFVNAFACVERVFLGPIETAREAPDEKKDQLLAVTFQERMEAALQMHSDVSQPTQGGNKRVAVCESMSHMAGEILRHVMQEKDCLSAPLLIVFMGASEITTAARAFVTADAYTALSECK